MALQLNENDPLYDKITSFICVDDDGQVKDLTGNVSTALHQSVVVSDGSISKVFTTANSNNDSRGVALSPDFAPHSTDITVLIVTDGVLSFGNRRSMLNTAIQSGNTISPAVLASGNASYTVGTAHASVDSGVDIRTGLHSTSIGQTLSPASHSFNVNGVEISSGATRYGYVSQGLSYIGGNSVGGYGYVNANYVYVIAFNEEISEPELSRLHNSLGPNNAFALVEKAPDQAVTLYSNIENQSQKVDGELRLDLSGHFSGTATPFSYAVVPAIAGVSIEGSELVVAQPALGAIPSDISNIVVRATDANSATADSNAFNVNWDASPWGVTRQDIEAADTTSGEIKPFLIDDFEPEDTANDRFAFDILTKPAQGNFEAAPDSTAIFYGDDIQTGEHIATAAVYKNGLQYGIKTISIIAGDYVPPLVPINPAILHMVNQ